MGEAAGTADEAAGTAVEAAGTAGTAGGGVADGVVAALVCSPGLLQRL